MVNVDDALRIAVDEIVGENLHVAGEDHEVGLVVFDERMDLCFGLLFVVFCDGDHDIGNFVEIGDGLIVGVVGNNQRDVAGEFAALVAVEEIDEAVVVLRNQNDHARSMRGLRQPPLHLELFRDRRKVFGEVGEVFVGEVFLREINVEIFGIEFDAHQEEAGFFVGVFVGVQNVASVAVDEVGNGGDFAFGVRAGDQQDGGVFHSLEERRSAAFLAFVLCDPRLHQLFYKSSRQRFVRCEADGAFRRLEVLKLVLELYGRPGAGEEAAMIRERGEAREHSFVFECRDAVADALGRFGWRR